MRMKLRRSQPKSHKARRALVAVGALGAVTAGIHRWRHRQNPDQPEQ
jgi:hypothetical protein